MLATGMGTSGTISGHVLLRMLEFCGRLGHDPQALCSRVGIRVESLSEPRTRLPFALVEQLSMVAYKRVADAQFGLHLAQTVSDKKNYDLGMAMLMASPTFDVALDKLAAHARYWGDGERLIIRSNKLGATITVNQGGASREYVRQVHECALAEVLVAARTLTGAALVPERVRFAHAPPRQRHEHDALFQCPVDFDAAQSELRFDRATLNTPMLHASDAFLAILEQQMRRSMERLPRARNQAEAVRQFARATLAGGDCSLEATARSLGLSGRSLQRRLQTEGTSYQEIVDTLRAELARGLIEQGLRAPQVAPLLGYSDETAFLHAFRRWTGTSPSRFADDAAPRHRS